jgi:hypothetical protein
MRSRRSILRFRSFWNLALSPFRLDTMAFLCPQFSPPVRSALGPSTVGPTEASRVWNEFGARVLRQMAKVAPVDAHRSLKRYL